MSGQPDASTSNQINQTTQGDRNQTIGQVYGGIVVYVSGGQAIINSADGSVTTPAPQSSRTLGPNPYKGLLAFNETDGDRYFGRADEIQTLWNTFRDLYNAENKPRLLPIYGPSGSGKSSLARAGLLPELGRRPLPGQGQARVAVLVPGSDSLYSLAVALAKVATEDPNPVKKALDFEALLKEADDDGDFTGLKRIAFGFPDIVTSPLIILVDQFEEIYAYEPKGNGTDDQQKREKFIARRDAFIKNLLFAASDSSQYVSVIITCRSDFLGDTQRYPEFNKLFSTQGFLVPIMQPDDLATAIAEPAKQAGYDFDPATVQLLVEQTRGYQGALPLLQFALQRIWEELEEGDEPLETLNTLGGVGGALAEEAQKLYNSLSKDEQVVAPRIFVALVQVNEGSEITRRRARKAEFVTSKNEIPLIESIIKKFAAPGVRFLVTFLTEEDGEVIELAHEALINNWGQFQGWIYQWREDLRKKTKIEDEAQEWKSQGKSKDYLLRGDRSEDAKYFLNIASQPVKLSSLATDYIEASWKQEKRWRLFILSLKLFTVFAVALPLLMMATTAHFYLSSRAYSILWSPGCDRNPEKGLLVNYLKFTARKELRAINLCNEILRGINFSNYNLSQANFSFADLSDSNFQQALLESAEFQDSFLISSNFQNAYLRDADFQNAQLTNADFTGAIVEGIDLHMAILQNTNFSGVNFEGVDLTNVNLEGAVLRDSINIQKAYFCNTQMPGYVDNRDCDKIN
ncbi:MAG: pentapeptide repeat-containing protein [Leptolyngbyaceae cyanobacterium]